HLQNAITGFDGATINYSYLYPTISSVTGTQDITVGPGVELTKLSPTDVLSFGTVDVSNDTIRIDFTSGLTFATGAFTGFRISDPYPDPSPITNVTLLENGGNANLDQSHIMFDGNHIWLNWEGMSFAAGSQIELGINFAGA